MLSQQCQIGTYTMVLAMLAESLAPYGEIIVVAPERDRSGASNSLTLDRPLMARKAASGFHDAPFPAR